MMFILRKFISIHPSAPRAPVLSSRLSKMRRFTLSKPIRKYGKPRKAMTVWIPPLRVRIYPVSVSLDLVKLPSTSNHECRCNMSSMIVMYWKAGLLWKGLQHLHLLQNPKGSARLCLTIHEDFSWGELFEETIIPHNHSSCSRENWCQYHPS